MNPPEAIPDPYGWIRRPRTSKSSSSRRTEEGRVQAEIDELIAQENTYTMHQTEHLSELRSDLIEEWKGYDGSSPGQNYRWVKLPIRNDDYWYYTRQDAAASSGYSVTARLPVGATGKHDESVSDIIDHIESHYVKDSPDVTTERIPGEEILLDERSFLASVSKNETNSSYFSVHSVSVSPDHQQVVFSVDTCGNEQFQLYWKSLENNFNSKRDPPQNNIHKRLLVPSMCGSVVWHEDSTRLYMLQADKTGRPYQLYEYRIQESLVTILFEESNPLQWCRLHQSFDGKFLLVSSSGPSDAAEYHALQLSLVHTSQDDLKKIFYSNMTSLEHGRGSWYGIFNRNAICRLADSCQTPPIEILDTHNKPLFPKDDATLSLDSFKVYPEQLVIQGRQSGLPKIWVVSMADNGKRVVATSVSLLQWEELAHYVQLEESSLSYELCTIYVSYQSMITPPQFWCIDLTDLSKRNLIHEQAVPGFNQKDYTCERKWIDSRDGKVKIPVSLVYRRELLEPNCPSPLHLYGYGAYGHCLESAFSSMRIPLLERGFVWATAHVRGGGENGKFWHNTGIQDQKLNSINDFVDVARGLVAEGYTNSSLLSCEGRSAGGLLAASAVNHAPDLFRVALLGVPFLDVLTSMTDASLPLTSVEWKEYGNPNEKVHYSAMKEFCPIQSIPNSTTAYPSCFLVGGLNDRRVPFSDPLKFAATVRYSQARANSNEVDRSRPLCVRLDTEAGHSFGSDKEKYYSELSLFYGFLIDQVQHQF